MRAILCSAIVCLLLPGCAAPLVPVTYEEKVSVQSVLPVHIRLNTGEVTGHSSNTMIYTGQFFVPVSSGPVPELQFGADDQATFIDSLETELVRHGIFGSISEEAHGGIVNLDIYFVKTEHYPSFQEYKLTVAMTAEYAGATAFHRYEVLSSEGDSTWEKWNTNASKGKLKAATKLLNLIMADIQEFVDEQQISLRTAVKKQQTDLARLLVKW